MAFSSAQIEALKLVATQLKACRDAAKCHACGCFQHFVDVTAPAFPGTQSLALELALAKAAFQLKRYDCRGCKVCYPALATNALTDAFPETPTSPDPDPAKVPAVQEGWPPLPGTYTVVRYAASVAVCTLHSKALVSQVADLAPDGLSIVGSLHTENLGIEHMIWNLRANPHLRFLVLCGEDTQQAVGHLPGQSLMSLFVHGLDEDGRIRGAQGKRPFLKNIPRLDVEAFLRQITLVPLLGETDPGHIAAEVRRCAAHGAAPFSAPSTLPAVPVLKANEPASLVLDPAGYVVVYPDRAKRLLRVEHFTNEGVLDTVLEGLTPSALSAALIEQGLITRLDHAAYIGRELGKAERSLETGEPYTQDQAPGSLPLSPPSSCGRSLPQDLPISPPR